MFIDKPWGSETVLEINDKYMFKKLFMKANNRCSLQYHNHKIETIYVLSGKLNIYTGSDPDVLIAKLYVEGDFITLKPGQIHRMEAITDSIYLEASSPEIDDVVRLQDDYRR